MGAITNGTFVGIFGIINVGFMIVIVGIVVIVFIVIIAHTTTSATNSTVFGRGWCIVIVVVIIMSGIRIGRNRGIISYLEWKSSSSPSSPSSQFVLWQLVRVKEWDYYSHLQRNSKVLIRYMDGMLKVLIKLFWNIRYGYPIQSQLVWANQRMCQPLSKIQTLVEYGIKTVRSEPWQVVILERGRAYKM